MFPNASQSLLIPEMSKNDEGTTVDIDAIMDNVSIVLYTLTVVLGITGNSMVIWVAGFKLKVDAQCRMRCKKRSSVAHCR